MKRYVVTLEKPEREELEAITRKGAHRSQKVINALILLNCDEGRFNERRSVGEAIAGVLRISPRTVDRVKRRFVEEGMEAALGGRQGRRPTYRRKADGEFEARDTVTLTYLMDAMHPIRDAQGLLAAPLADEPVRNQTGIPPEPAAVLDMAQGGARPGRLDLSSRNLTDLSALAGLSGVRELDLRDNAITDLSPLSDLSELEVLDLSGNRIEELWPLAGLPELERLNLSGNRITDIDMLSGLSGLEVLLLDRNRVADVRALSPLTDLANLGLSANRIEDIGLLANLGRLRRLDLSGNAVADVSALGDVSELLWLRLPGNPVSDVAPLGRLEMLRWLWLDSGTTAGMEALALPRGRGAAPLWIERVPAQ